MSTLRLWEAPDYNLCHSCCDFNFLYVFTFYVNVANCFMICTFAWCNQYGMNNNIQIYFGTTISVLPLRKRYIDARQKRECCLCTHRQSVMDYDSKWVSKSVERIYFWWNGFRCVLDNSVGNSQNFLRCRLWIHVSVTSLTIHKTFPFTIKFIHQTKTFNRHVFNMKMFKMTSVVLVQK